MRYSTTSALIADDDEFFRMALRTVLTSTLGFSHVLEAENFDQATALLSENKIDLAVFDLMMPGMAGIIKSNTARSILFSDSRAVAWSKFSASNTCENPSVLVRTVRRAILKNSSRSAIRADLVEYLM